MFGSGAIEMLSAANRRDLPADAAMLWSQRGRLWRSSHNVMGAIASGHSLPAWETPAASRHGARSIQSSPADFARHFHGMPKSVRVRPVRNRRSHLWNRLGLRMLAEATVLKTVPFLISSLLSERRHEKTQRVCPRVCPERCARASGHDNEVTPSCCPHLAP